MSVPLWGWAAVVAAIVALLSIDLLAHRGGRVVAAREAALWSAVWVSCGVAFGGLVWGLYGGEAGGEYFAGYVIEKSLAVDNVFVFALLLSSFGVPRAYHHRVLFLGVVGALVFRAALIAGGAVLISRAHWVLYVFGAFLVVTGARLLRHRDHDRDPARHPVLRLTRRVLPISDDYDGGRLLTRVGGRLVATPLLAVVVLVETTDIVFAVDSIPAIFAVTQEPFLVFTSNAFAILGLRAMYFLLADLMQRFVYLKVALAAVLVAVGAKLLLLDVYEVPIAVSLGVVVAILATAVVASLRATRPPAPVSAAPVSELGREDPVPVGRP